MKLILTSRLLETGDDASQDTSFITTGLREQARCADKHMRLPDSTWEVYHQPIMAIFEDTLQVKLEWL